MDLNEKLKEIQAAIKENDALLLQNQERSKLLKKSLKSYEKLIEKAKQLEVK